MDLFINLDEKLLSKIFNRFNCDELIIDGYSFDEHNINGKVMLEFFKGEDHFLLHAIIYGEKDIYSCNEIQFLNNGLNAKIGLREFKRFIMKELLKYIAEELKDDRIKD